MSNASAVFVMALACICVAVQAEGKENSYPDTTASYGVHRVKIAGGTYLFNLSRTIAKVQLTVEGKRENGLDGVLHPYVLMAFEAQMDATRSPGTEPQLVRFVPAKLDRCANSCSIGNQGKHVPETLPGAEE